MSLPTLLTVLVAVAFAYLLYRVLRPGAKERLEPHARIPLDDDQPLGDDPDHEGDKR
jgi:cbb3-type cytochrome oxidase subunit 3